MKHLSGNRNEYRAIGLMSGTSLDGLDIAACIFYKENNNWSFSVENAITLPYPPEWESHLAKAQLMNGEELIVFHSRYGEFIGEKIVEFIDNTGFEPDLIASHGHTIYHQPENGITFQAGNGAAIAAITGIPTVADFRITDVALGGQGAPLVPAGDRLLFSNYDYCLNLGGFANISFLKEGKLIAFDICPTNFVLNYLAGKTGSSFDNNGETGKTGNLVTPLLEKLNNLDFYRQEPPKSLGREWVEKHFFPLLDSPEVSVPDLLRTVYEHIGIQIGRYLSGNAKVLVTGGGAFNKFLIEKIKENTEVEIILPSASIISYKEALIFAFLGVLRILNEINCFASVTGAKRDSSCGVIFIP
jgi:anhydro-N-acetylmuramic acid kinase